MLSTGMQTPSQPMGMLTVAQQNQRFQAQQQQQQQQQQARHIRQQPPTSLNPFPPVPNNATAVRRVSSQPTLPIAAPQLRPTHQPVPPPQHQQLRTHQQQALIQASINQRNQVMSSLTQPGPSTRPRMSPDNQPPMPFYPNAQFQPTTQPRPPYSPFVPSSTPPTDIQQASTPTRPSFIPPPAQQYDSPQVDMYATASFGMAPPPTIPRPPSQQQQQHHSPAQMQIHTAHHPQRPQSQPQASHHHQPQVPARPPSQAGPSQTPRPLQPPLPPVGLTAAGRIPQGQQPHPIAPRPSATTPAAAAPGHPPPGPDPPSTSATSSALRQPPQMPNGTTIGSGSGLKRLLQFSGELAGESGKTPKLQWSWWNDLVKEYFTPKAVMKLTLWKDNQRNEAKPFEIGIPILPRFFLVTTQSGVKSMTLSLDGARERVFGQGHSVVECVAAVWTYRYTNGYTVTLRGPLTAHVIVAATQPPPSASTPGPSSSTASTQQQPAYTLKFEEFQFDANFHDKFIALDAIIGTRSIEPPKAFPPSPTPLPAGASQIEWDRRWEETRRWEEPRTVIEHGSMPGEPVNAFGIPQATMRCLELAESVSAMAELIGFAKETDQGPLDALKSFAQKIREAHPQQPAAMQQQGQPQQHQGQLPPPHLVNGGALTPFQSYPHTPSTLYSSASPSITHPAPPGPPSSMNSPQNTPSSSTNSPDKHPKSIPQQQLQQHGPGPAPPLGQMPTQAQLQQLQGQLQGQIPPPPQSTPGLQQSQVPTPSGAGSSPAISSGGTTNTPAMANASLKRKQVGGDAASPTMGTGEQAPGGPQPKQQRVPRKRGRTGTTGGG